MDEHLLCMIVSNETLIIRLHNIDKTVYIILIMKK
jgi:hypothetical protein